MLGTPFRLWIKDSPKYVEKDPLLVANLQCLQCYIQSEVLQIDLILKEVISPQNVLVLAEGECI